MKDLPIHRWDVTTAEAVAIQKKFSRGVIVEDGFKPIQYIAGVDIGYQNNIGRAAIVILTHPGLKPVDSVVASSRVDFPYRTGLLSFREIPPLLKAFDRLKINPDLILVDGQGIAHPRRFGIASHLGMWLGLATIGCAKSHLWGKYRPPARAKGSFSYLEDRSGIVGAALRTRTGVKVVYVSPGHKISVDSSIRIVLTCCPKYRIPEPIRRAHHLASWSPD